MKGQSPGLRTVKKYDDENRLRSVNQYKGKNLVYR